MENRVPPKSSNPNARDQEHNRREETPKRPWPEGPGGPDEAKGAEDARNKSTRTGER
ncbi:MAG TPA: hypothetical protein VFJ86_08670 [Usitatibacter sp.]|jgi:hypothetical protein|nr:hypothetical protein [Usitatibacter sp.]